jgi:hypothetical protein
MDEPLLMAYGEQLGYFSNQMANQGGAATFVGLLYAASPIFVEGNGIGVAFGQDNGASRLPKLKAQGNGKNRAHTKPVCPKQGSPFPLVSAEVEPLFGDRPQADRCCDFCVYDSVTDRYAPDGSTVSVFDDSSVTLFCKLKPIQRARVRKKSLPLRDCLPTRISAADDHQFGARVFALERGTI